jgi:hypothetical protein
MIEFAAALVVPFLLVPAATALSLGTDRPRGPFAPRRKRNPAHRPPLL